MRECGPPPGGSSELTVGVVGSLSMLEEPNASKYKQDSPCKRGRLRSVAAANPVFLFGRNDRRP